LQYTIRKISLAIDKAVRQRARAEGKSLNAVAVKALADGLGLQREKVVRRDLGDIVGTWARDAATERALAAQHRIDKALWK
jgi:hypothetical protein